MSLNQVVQALVSPVFANYRKDINIVISSGVEKSRVGERILCVRAVSAAKENRLNGAIWQFLIVSHFTHKFEQRSGEYEHKLGI